MSSFLELTWIYPHALHELVLIGGLAFVTQMLSMAADDHQGQRHRLIAFKLLHAVAVYTQPHDGCVSQASAAA